MKILVTGSNGLLGQKLVWQLSSDATVQLTATSRGDNRCLAPQEYQYLSMNVTDKEEVLQVVGEVKPDVIIHTAAMTNVDACEDDQKGCDVLNVDAVEYLIKACQQNKAFLVHLSTDFIFDGTSGPYKEEDEANPISYYGESKLKAEELIEQSDIEWAIARTVLVYGSCPGLSRSNIVLWVKNSVEAAKDIQVVTDQWRTPTLAEDLAKGCVLIAKSKNKGVFNISGEEMLTPYDMAMITADFFDLDKSFITPTDISKFQQRAKRPPKTGFDISKAKNILGYQPKTFKEGIAIMMEQVEKNV